LLARRDGLFRLGLRRRWRRGRQRRQVGDRHRRRYRRQIGVDRRLLRRDRWRRLFGRAAAAGLVRRHRLADQAALAIDHLDRRRLLRRLQPGLSGIEQGQSRQQQGMADRRAAEQALEPGALQPGAAQQRQAGGDQHGAIRALDRLTHRADPRARVGGPAGRARFERQRPGARPPGERAWRRVEHDLVVLEGAVGHALVGFSA
jgi:hypothetical protein